MPGPRIPINWLTNLPLVLPGPQVMTQVPWRSKFFIPQGVNPNSPIGEPQPVRMFGKALYGLEDYVDGVKGSADWL